MKRVGRGGEVENRQKRATRDYQEKVQSRNKKRGA